MKPEQKTELHPLDAEIDAFERVQARLRRENPEGGFVVIKDGKVLGVWRDEFDALGEGIKKYGDVVFLVRDINQTDEPECFTRDIFGIGGFQGDKSPRFALSGGANPKRQKNQSRAKIFLRFWNSRGFPCNMAEWTA